MDWASVAKDKDESADKQTLVLFFETFNFELDKSNRPYEKMNIIGVSGFAEATIATLKALGFVDSVA